MTASPCKSSSTEQPHNAERGRSMEDFFFSSSSLLSTERVPCLLKALLEALLRAILETLLGALVKAQLPGCPCFAESFKRQLSFVDVCYLQADTEARKSQNLGAGR